MATSLLKGFGYSGPKKSKCRPLGGAGTIDICRRAVNKTPAFQGIFKLPGLSADVAEMTRFPSKLGKTEKSIRWDSSDSCHRVSLTLG
jgi:hypothetical protein